MSVAASIALQSAQLASQILTIKPQRGIYPQNPASFLPIIVAQATLEERHIDRLEITSHPVEQGAAVSDHAFVLPSEVLLRLGWSNSSTPDLIEQLSSVSASWASTLGGSVGGAVAGAYGAFQAIDGLISVSSIDAVTEAYNAILDLYYSRELFTLYTGKRAYYNMMCRLVATETDYKSANSLFITMECQQLIVVDTQLTSLSDSTQADPSATASPSEEGTQQATADSHSGRVGV